MESSCCIKVTPFQLLTFSLIFFALYHVYDASFEEDQLNQEANRLGVCIVTDDHFVRENFGGNKDAAFNHIIHLFQAKKETLENIFNHTFGFDLLAIKLGHPAFSQVDLEQQTPTGVINVTELKSSVRLREALSTELFAYPLVLYLTNRAFSDGHYGLKLGSADSPPHNLVAVSLNGLGLQNGSFSEIGLGRKRNPSKRLLILLIHELLHGVGVPHSNNTDNDLMKEFSPVGLNMSDSTKTQAEMLFQAAQDEGLLSPHNDTVRLVTYSADGQPNEKSVSYQNVVEYMLERQADRLPFWTRIWEYGFRQHKFLWLSAILVTALICVVLCVWKWPTNAQENENEEGERVEMPPVEPSQDHPSVSIIISPDLTTSMSDMVHILSAEC